MTEPCKYRKKPVEIEAMQWDGAADSATPIIDWALGQDQTIRFWCESADSCKKKSHVLQIDTLEGTMSAMPGDYIIRGVQGEFYPCKPDIFHATYEEVED